MDDESPELHTQHTSRYHMTGSRVAGVRLLGLWVLFWLPSACSHSTRPVPARQRALQATPPTPPPLQQSTPLPEVLDPLQNYTYIFMDESGLTVMADELHHAAVAQGQRPTHYVFAAWSLTNFSKALLQPATLLAAEQTLVSNPSSGFTLEPWQVRKYSRWTFPLLPLLFRIMHASACLPSKHCCTHFHPLWPAPCANNTNTRSFHDCLSHRFKHRHTRWRAPMSRSRWPSRACHEAGVVQPPAHRHSSK